MNPEEEAQKLLEELGIITLPVIPKELCRRLEIHYAEEPLKGFDGFLIMDPASGDSVIGVNALIAEQGRKNFTGAHEIGHYALDSLTQNAFQCSRETIESYNPNIEPIELRANRFAAELLMPRFIYQPLVDKRDAGWEEIKELSAMSQTTLTSTAIRFVDLTSEACCLVASQAQRTAWFRPGKEFRPYIQVGPLARNTVAYAAFQGISPPDYFVEIKADNWLTGRGINASAEILEWSLPMNSYGQVLTLLYGEKGLAGWQDEGDEDEEDEEVEWEPPTFHKSKRTRQTDNEKTAIVLRAPAGQPVDAYRY